MTEIGIGLFCGVTLGLSAAPLWMMLQIPMRICDATKSNYNMRVCAWALALGASVAALSPVGFLPIIFGILALCTAGLFTGMIAAALVEAVEVIPVLYDRLSISTDMRVAGFAIAIGKGLGALLTGPVLGG